VLSCLHEQPRHPYEIAATLRQRGADQAIKLNYGSLYTVMEQLRRHGLIAEKETLREGNRPERTIYRLTADGRDELTDWLSELIAVPVKEYTRFEAGLALLASLAPEEAMRLLAARAEALAAQLAGGRARFAEVKARQKLPRLFLIEWEYKMTLAEAELAWVRQLAADIASGALEGVDQWRAWRRRQDEAPAESDGAESPAG
jgi:DNA-binding PadR family transcriptional regulator